MRTEYVQFGCGLCAPPTWRNFDASPMLWIQKNFPFVKPALKHRGYPDFPVQAIEFGDIVAGLPIQPGSADAVYCSHVLEHLSLSEFRTSLRNVFSYLRPGGRFRLVVPDMQFLIERYLSDPRPGAISDFMMATRMGETHAEKGVRAALHRTFGHSRHKWMWDYKALEQQLSEAGFECIRRAHFNDSEDIRFREVEAQERWQDCLGVDCVRPVHPPIESTILAASVATAAVDLN